MDTTFSDFYTFDAIQDDLGGPIVRPDRYGTVVSHSGFSAQVVGYALDTDKEAVMFNIVGNQTSIDSIVASFHSNRIDWVAEIRAPRRSESSKEDSDSRHRYVPTVSVRAPTETRWRVFKSKEPSLSLVNAIILNEKLVNPKFGGTAYVAGNNAEEIVRGVGMRIKSRINSPVLDNWHLYLYIEGRAHGMIRIMEGYGVKALKINMDVEKWESLIENGVMNNRITY